jgi:hypothetical protein
MDLIQTILASTGGKSWFRIAGIRNAEHQKEREYSGQSRT